MGKVLDFKKKSIAEEIEELEYTIGEPITFESLETLNSFVADCIAKVEEDDE